MAVKGYGHWQSNAQSVLQAKKTWLPGLTTFLGVCALAKSFVGCRLKRRGEAEAVFAARRRKRNEVPGAKDEKSGVLSS
jgi:hypothetical protein